MKSDLRARGVLSFALSSMCMQPYGLNALVIGYAAYSAPDIEHAIEQLGAVLRGLQAAGGSPQRYQPAGEKTQPRWRTVRMRCTAGSALPPPSLARMR